MTALLTVCGALFVGFTTGAQAAPPGGTPPGQLPCSHGLGSVNGNAGPCKDDPQPARGKDCEAHGNNGGFNEDHCKGEESPPPWDGIPG
jgi:hypothetical protein